MHQETRTLPASQPQEEGPQNGIGTKEFLKSLDKAHASTGS